MVTPGGNGASARVEDAGHTSLLKCGLAAQEAEHLRAYRLPADPVGPAVQCLAGDPCPAGLSSAEHPMLLACDQSHRRLSLSESHATKDTERV